MSNLRWIMRDGEKVLQKYLPSGKVEWYNGPEHREHKVIYEWKDVPCVPLEEEQVTG